MSYALVLEMSLWRLHSSAPLDCVVLAVSVSLFSCWEPALNHRGLHRLLASSLGAGSLGYVHRTYQDPTDYSLYLECCLPSHRQDHGPSPAFFNLQHTRVPLS